MHLILYFFEILINFFKSKDIYVSLIFFVFFDAIMAISNKVRPFNFNKFFFLSFVELPFAGIKLIMFCFYWYIKIEN